LGRTGHDADLARAPCRGGAGGGATRVGVTERHLPCGHRVLVGERKKKIRRVFWSLSSSLMIFSPWIQTGQGLKFSLRD
jgi:hypothetical protein